MTIRLTPTGQLRWAAPEGETATGGFASLRQAFQAGFQSIDEGDTVTVSGTFSGMADGLPFTKSASATTNASGVAVINGGKKKNAASLTFCVGNLTHATLVYDQSANVVTCDDS